MDMEETLSTVAQNGPRRGSHSKRKSPQQQKRSDKPQQSLPRGTNRSGRPAGQEFFVERQPFTTFTYTSTHTHSHVRAHTHVAHLLHYTAVLTMALVMLVAALVAKISSYTGHQIRQRILNLEFSSYHWPLICEGLSLFVLTEDRPLCLSQASFPLQLNCLEM